MMKRLFAVLCLGVWLSAMACSGNVVTSSSGGSPVECASATDEDVKGLVGKACDKEDEECMSNNGCGGCSVTCKNGKWESTDKTLCYDVGPTC